MSNNVFVYGSLKQGYGNNRLLATATFVCKDQTVDERFDLRCWGSYPAVYKDSDGTAVIGELYEVSDGTMENLDCLEGYPSFYNREKVSLRSGVEAWMYYIDAHHGEPEGSKCETGEWRPSNA